MIDINDERFWDILFEEACVEGPQANRIKKRLMEIDSDGWIPLTPKQLPEDKESVLWCDDDGVMMIGVLFKDYYLDFGVAEAENYNQFIYDPIAWMRLPKRYRKKKETK